MSSRGLSVLVLMGLLLVLLSCARDQQLVSINVVPSSETIGDTTIPVQDDAGAQVQLKAFGSYIHPPVTKEVTNLATWESNTPDIATVDSAGLLTATGIACGNTLVSATVRTDHSLGGRSSSGAIVVGRMTATVVCFVPPQNATVKVNFAGTGTGAIVSSVPGLSCARTCSDGFDAGTSLMLTATPDGSFAGWSGCDSVSKSGTVCTVRNLSSDRNLTATFN